MNKYNSNVTLVLTKSIVVNESNSARTCSACRVISSTDLSVI